MRVSSQEQEVELPAEAHPVLLVLALVEVQPGSLVQALPVLVSLVQALEGQL